MADVFSAEKRSAVMSAIRSKDTKPEIAIRSALHRLGYRFRLHVSTMPGRPDIVLPRYATAIQIRGCFWHGHTCPDGHLPNSRRDYWIPKLSKNQNRDRRNDSKLRRSGWSLLIVWECQCTPSKLSKTIKRIERHLLNRRIPT